MLPPPLPLPGYPQRHHDSERVKGAACAVPPPGWRCTRAAGHSGPCAAVPDAGPPKLPPPPVTDSFRVGWRGVSLAIPMSLVTALVTALVTHWATPASLAPNDELRGQVRDIAQDVRELKRDARDDRTALAEERAYTARDIPLMASVIEQGCSAKFAWHDGQRPPPPDWLPPPLNGRPQWQPALALLPPPGD